jgi:hypothetical protein
MSDYPVIDDPIAWQEMMDNAPASINLRGSERFWNTVNARGIKGMIYRDGCPEFTTIAFDLGDDIALVLSAQGEESPYIKFRFERIEQEHTQCQR